MIQLSGGSWLSFEQEAQTMSADALKERISSLGWVLVHEEGERTVDLGDDLFQRRPALYVAEWTGERARPQPYDATGKPLLHWKRWWSRSRTSMSHTRARSALAQKW